MHSQAVDLSNRVTVWKYADGLGWQVIIYIWYMFVYFEREGQRTRLSQEGAERGREDLKSAPCCYHRTWCRAWSHELRSWPEPKSRVGHLNDWATQVPFVIYFFLELVSDSIWSTFLLKLKLIFKELGNGSFTIFFLESGMYCLRRALRIRRPHDS